MDAKREPRARLILQLPVLLYPITGSLLAARPTSSQEDPGAMEQGAATREASPDREHQAQTAVPQSNYRALDVFHWFISIWQDLKSQGHKTQSYYFISGKRTMMSLERCPFVSRGRAQSREHKHRIPNKCIPQPGLPGHSTAPASSQCWNMQREHPQTAQHSKYQWLLRFTRVHKEH